MPPGVGHGRRPVALDTPATRERAMGRGYDEGMARSGTLPVRVRPQLAVLLMAALLAGAGAALAGEPGPTPVTRTCADRYPVTGPAGLDLRLGCIAAEIVGSVTGAGSRAEEARISSWLLPIGLFLAGLLVLTRLVPAATGRLNRRMAPATPEAWWACPRCRSLNPAGSTRCYACGAPWRPEALTIDGATGQLRRPDTSGDPLAPGRETGDRSRPDH
jgi:hypothetical protein